ncbi:MAG: sigma 54-interacting transcriptional regulator, partial [Myxococcales bacterium]|nr:sigma 54-interacting transcriptional regulator [Myxococcales bacterium]
MHSPDSDLPLDPDRTQRIQHVSLELEVHHHRYVWILLVYHRDGVETAVLKSGDAIVVGREAPAHVVIPEASLSRRHARFSRRDSSLLVEDLGSTNGTWIGDKRISESIHIEPGIEVSLGGVCAIVSIQSVTGTSDLQQTGVDAHDVFRYALDAEIVRTRFFRRSLAVLFVRSPKTGVHRWCTEFRKQMRPVDRMGLYSTDAVEVLMPEATREEAEVAFRSFLEKRALGLELVCGIATFPQDGASSATLTAASREAAVGAARPSLASPNASIVAQSASMRAVVDTATRLARSSIHVLLQGETGAGKEVIARLIHERSARSKQPMVTVHCGGMALTLTESTLFGHEKGAFTGAIAQHKGVFEVANGGTVFLDEIGELPPSTQATLLRVLESKQIVRVGSTKDIRVDVRIVAATHRDLDAMCERGEFRRDLFFRLNTAPLKLPALRDRPEDIEPLARHFLKRAAEANNVNVPQVDDKAIALLRAYSWPGNVRELRNVMERAVAITESDVITERELPEEMRRVSTVSVPPADDGSAVWPVNEGLHERMKRFEREQIMAALRAVGGRQVEAATSLNVAHRTLQHRMKLLGIKRRSGTYVVADSEED